MPFDCSDQGGDHAPGRLRPALCQRSARTSSIWRRSASAGLKLGVDPLGGAAVHYWEPINAIYGLDIAVVNPKIDPTFSFMTVDHDGKIRMDCSSPYAMARLVALKDQYQVAFANDPDSDRHGIVTPSAGLMNPNHYLAVAIRYLLTHRPHWPSRVGGRQDLGEQQHDRPRRARARPSSCARCRLASSGLCPDCSTDRSASAEKRAPGQVFCDATAPCGRRTRTARSWTCLAAEITARTGKDPGEHYRGADSGIRHP